MGMGKKPGSPVRPKQITWLNVHATENGIGYDPLHILQLSN